MQREAETSASTWPRVTAAFALAAVVALHLAIVWRHAGRALDHDEGEHLRAAAWLASGRMIYRDFAENHAPLLYQLLAPFASPANASVAAMRSYVTSARVLTGVAGTLAALCVGAFAMRFAGRPIAAAGAVVPLLLIGWTSLRAFDDVRPEPFTLLLFWAGALLLVTTPAAGIRDALLLGAGIGLIAAAAVWNPKWPAESLVMGIWFCRRALELARVSRRLALAAVLVAAAIPVVVLLIALRATTLHDFVFFAFQYPAAISRWYRTSPLGTVTNLAYCSPWLRPWLAIPAAVVVALLARSKRVVLPLLLLAAGALEVRFVYSYPRLWPQYFAMWACCVAVVYGLLVAEASELARDRYGVAAGALLIVFFIHEMPVLIREPDERHWMVKEALHDRLRPGEAAWVRPEEYPMAVPAGSWYWYAFDDQVPFTIEYARRPEARGFIPPLRDEDLPPCRVLRAQQSGAPLGYVHVRLMDRRAVRHLPQSEQCMRELWQMGMLRRIGLTPLWEVQPPPR